MRASSVMLRQTGKNTPVRRYGPSLSFRSTSYSGFLPELHMIRLHRIVEGWLRYAREKQNPLGTTQGLQLPKRGSPERVYDSNILTKDDIRKGGIKMSQSVADNSPSLEQSITQKAKYQAGAALGSVKN